MCVCFAVGINTCILGDIVTLYMEEIFYTIQLLNHEFLLISGREFDISFVYFGKFYNLKKDFFLFY